MGTNNAINLNETGIAIYDSTTGEFVGVPLAKGQLIVYDGTALQYIPLPTSTDGLFLSVDSTTDTGFLWAPAGGGSGFTWINVTNAASPISMTVDTGYFSSDASNAASYTLPTTAAVGTILRVANMQPTLNFTITQASGQSIIYGNKETTVGASGSLSSVSIGDAVELLCIVADTQWQVLSTQGNLSFV